MRFGSVCSGIEAASVAWHPLGWQAAWLAEIEPFPSAVLKHHYPAVPNLGDMTTLPARIMAGEVEAPDLFCGGTPCQAFSVAGLRRSLDDARGNLSLTFIEIADAIDAVRRGRGEQPAVVFWENVPGVLSTKDNAFGCFLAGLAGEDEPLVAPGGKWTDAGCVLGPTRAVAWRILDAQYFGLAQRRRRVFVVASARDGFDPLAVLFEREGVRRDTAPSREAGQSTAPTIDASFGCLQGCSGQDLNHGHSHLISMCLNAGGQRRLDAESETLLPTIGGGFDVAHSLRGEGFDASEDGTGRGTPLAPVAHAFDARQSDVIQYGDKTGPLDTCGNTIGVMQPVAFNTTQLTHPANRSNPKPGDPCHTLAAGAHAPAVAFQSATEFLPQALRVYSEAEAAPTLRATDRAQQIHAAMQVRRLTPTECERLQGFPDHYTAIPWRKKPASECPDGPRYKALGNSWAVPVVRWIGWRIVAAVRGAA